MLAWKGHLNLRLLAIWQKCVAFFGQGNSGFLLSLSSRAPFKHSASTWASEALEPSTRQHSVSSQQSHSLNTHPALNSALKNWIITFKCGGFFHAVMSRRRTQQSVHMYTKTHRHKHINNNSAEWLHHAAESSKEVAGEVLVAFLEGFQQPLQTAAKLCVCVCAHVG